MKFNSSYTIHIIIITAYINSTTNEKFTMYALNSSKLYLYNKIKREELKVLEILLE